MSKIGNNNDMIPRPSHALTPCAPPLGAGPPAADAPAVLLPREALALVDVAHEDRTRYSMDVLRVEADAARVRVVATDGRAMALVDYDRRTIASEAGAEHDVSAAAPPCVRTVPRAAVEAARKHAKPRKGEPERCKVIAIGADSVSAESAAGGAARIPAPEPVDAVHFPPYGDVLPKDKGGAGRVVVRVNVDLLARVARALHDACGRDPTDDAIAVLSVPLDLRAPILVALSGGAGKAKGIGAATRALGLVMPTAGDDDADARAFNT